MFGGQKFLLSVESVLQRFHLCNFLLICAVQRIAETPPALHHGRLCGACKRSHSLRPKALSLLCYPDSHFMFPLKPPAKKKHDHDMLHQSRGFQK